MRSVRMSTRGAARLPTNVHTTVSGSLKRDAAEQFIKHCFRQCYAAEVKRFMPLLMEVGHLAVSTPGDGRWLITALTAYLSASRYEWVVFTIGPGLQNAFKRLGISLVDLGEADPSKLAESQRGEWGSYYEQRPRVMAGSIAEGHLALWQLCKREAALMNMWSAAVAAGRASA
ncbi:MAG: thermostable hemolysin [Candidatus Thiodiazotropha sp. (ex Dulcina madagascariensis)]|nr:thermostable hemolysin [Candidatus Thiodiazotropha sp. (ex Dulcina madagascariensis)]MCU7927908.1 thermostable hemolysin [Candidatus Thiodiazotropha sp. (ex Dulcina madagascariensis)]